MAPIPRKNAALIPRFLTDVVAGGDVDAVDGFLASDVADHNLVFGDSRDHGRVTEMGWRVLSATDVGVNLADFVATNDHIAVRGTVTGTHRESLMELAPTDRSFEIAHTWFAESMTIGSRGSGRYPMASGSCSNLMPSPKGL